MSKRKKGRFVTEGAEQSRKITSFFTPQKRPRIEETARQEKIPVEDQDAGEGDFDPENYTQDFSQDFVHDEDGPFDFFSGGADIQSSQLVPQTQANTNSAWLWAPLTDVQEIRVLTIEPSNSEDEPLRCNFRTTSLEAPCDYFALSYCWGETHPDGSHLTHTIVCDDHLFSITSNLHEALLRLRKLHSGAARRASRYKLHIPALWIDAVCIDQNNPVERSRQIMIMDKIFQNAQHLLVWLGGHYTSEPVIHEHEMRSFLSPDPVDEDIRTNINERLRQRAFFGRRWVVQEVFLCGNRHSVLIGDFIFSSDNLKEVLKDPTSTAISHSHIVRSDPSSSREKKPSLFRNLSRYESFDCSDDRDKIYALRSISSDGGALPIDYRLPTANVFLDLAVRWLQAGHLMPVLVCAVTRTPRQYTVGDDTLPSWVPNWQVASSNKAIIDFTQTHRRQRDIRALKRRDTQLLSDQLYTDARLTRKDEELPEGSCVVENGNSLHDVQVRLTGWIVNKCLCAQNSDAADDCVWCFFLPHVKQAYGIDNAHHHRVARTSDESDKPVMPVMEHIWNDQLRLFVLENGWILLISSPTKERVYTLRGVLETQNLVLADDEWTSTRLSCSLPQRSTETIYLR